MAVRRRLGNLAEMLLKQHLSRNQATFESDLMGQRQRENAKHNAELSVMESLRTNPELARRFAQAYPNRSIGDISTNVFVPTPEQNAAAAAKEIDEVSSLGGLPTQEGLSTRFGSLVPSIEELQAQRQAKEKGFHAAERPELKETVNPDGSKALIAVNPRTLQEQIPTEIGPVQAGRLKGEAEVAETGIAGPARIRQAAGVAGAQESARLSAEGRYMTSEQGQAAMRAKAQAALNQATSQAQGAAIVKATETSARFLPNVLELEKKWKQAQPEIARLVEGGILNDANTEIIQARGIQGLPQTIQQMMSPAVRQYFEMRQTYLPIFARVLSEVGNLNEQEQLRAAGLAPSGIDALNGGGSGVEKLERMKTLLVNMPQVTQAFFNAQGQPAEERLRVIEQFLPQEAEQPLQEGPVNPALDAARQKLNLLRGR